MPAADLPAQRLGNPRVSCHFRIEWNFERFKGTQDSTTNGNIVQQTWTEITSPTDYYKSLKCLSFHQRERAFDTTLSTYNIIKIRHRVRHERRKQQQNCLHNNTRRRH